MRVFVTGATGFIGSAVVRELLAHGHQVTGLARSDRAAAALHAAGAQPHAGSLRDVGSLRRGAEAADGAIHLAFTFSLPELGTGRLLKVVLGGSPTRLVNRAMSAIMDTDRAAIDALGDALQGSGRPLVTTFGVMGLAGAPGDRAARTATEDDAPDPASPGYGRALNERAVAHWASRGVRASLVRLAPSVHGEKDTGLVPQLIAAARKRGEAIYVGDGGARWSGVHRQDAAVLFRLALEKGAAGARYHGVAEEGVPFRSIAETIARRLDLPATSTSLAEAKRRLGWFGPFIAVDNPASSLATRRDLGWSPSGPGLLEDLDSDRYFAPQA